MTQPVKKKRKPRNPNGAKGKPVSLWGAKFEDVLAALLKTRPAAKREKKTG